jgi:5-methylcytosine-specific restriction endonuclease McrA
MGIKNMMKTDKTTCSRCGGVEYKCHVHHKDRNRDNNSLENLEIVCPFCHGHEHGQENTTTGQVDTCFEMSKFREGYRIVEGFRLMGNR